MNYLLSIALKTVTNNCKSSHLLFFFSCLFLRHRISILFDLFSISSKIRMVLFDCWWRIEVWRIKFHRIAQAFEIQCKIMINIQALCTFQIRWFYWRHLKLLFTFHWKKNKKKEKDVTVAHTCHRLKFILFLHRCCDLLAIIS